MVRKSVRYSIAMLSGTLGLGAVALYGCGGGSNVNTSGLPGGKATRAQTLRGRHLMTTGACADCHSGGGTDPASPLWLAGSKAGTPNASFAIGPFTTYPANLTPDATTGIGTWTAQDIFNALRNGKGKDGKFLAPPMPWPKFRDLTDEDIYAIAAYLQSIKPVDNAVPVSTGPPGADGKPDWTGTYATLKPTSAYPASNENNVP